MNRTQGGRAGGRADGLAAISIRPARTADLPALRDFFADLSMRSRYLRFFAPVTPGPALLDRLCGGAGTADALLATWGAIIVGHAMAADRPGSSGTQTTEIGVVVADAWQGQGIGSALVQALIDGAQARGVTSVTMDVLHDNHRMLALIARLWPAACTRRGRDYDTICAQVPHRQHQHQHQHQPAVRSAPPGTRRPALLARAGRA
jgi:ribosomal protein S18 acetylase RimI-like enzyme